MVTHLLDRPLVPIADENDAVATYEAFRPYLLETEVKPIVVHVIEKTIGAPDKTSVEQREQFAEKGFKAFRNRAETDGIETQTKLLYGSDIAKTIHTAVNELDASAIVFRSRDGNRWLDLVTGNVRARLITNHDRPVIVLPSKETQS